ncbi:MAG: hypothetical protein CBC85_002290, partial [Hyphomonadaceae bacterium TMED125]
MKLGSLLQSGEHFAVVIQNNAAYRLLAGEEGTSLNLQDWISRPDALRKAALKAIETAEAIEFTPEMLGPPVLKPRKI